MTQIPNTVNTVKKTHEKLCAYVVISKRRTGRLYLHGVFSYKGLKEFERNKGKSPFKNAMKEPIAIPFNLLNNWGYLLD